MTHRDRDEIKRAVSARMNESFSTSEWTLEQKFVLGARVLAMTGHAQTLFGQFSVRLPDGLFMSQAFGVGLEETRLDNLVTFDADLNVVRGNGAAHPGLRFHCAIYEKRPDVSCIVHSHPEYSVALAMTGRRLEPASMDSAMFYGDVAYLDYWPGVPEADEEAEIISSALGKSSTILLANHGLLAVGDSIEKAVYYAVFFERAAMAQVRAQSIGELQPVLPKHGREAFEAMNRPGWINANFAYLCRKAQRAAPDLHI
jgi:L-fuculose-phosphate aldolase